MASLMSSSYYDQGTCPSSASCSGDDSDALEDEELAACSIAASTNIGDMPGWREMTSRQQSEFIEWNRIQPGTRFFSLPQDAPLSTSRTTGAWTVIATTRLRDVTSDSSQALCADLSAGQTLSLSLEHYTRWQKPIVAAKNQTGGTVGNLSFEHADSVLQSYGDAPHPPPRELPLHRLVVLRVTGGEPGKPYRGVNVELQQYQSAASSSAP